MKTNRQKFGLALTIVSGLGLVYILVSIAHRYMTDGIGAWIAVASVLIVGIFFIGWGIKDLFAHQVDARKKDNKVYNTPNNESSE